MSLIESLCNVVVGYLVALAVQVILFPHLGIHLDLYQNMLIGLVFTAVSIVRGYLVRRLFNGWGRGVCHRPMASYR